MMNKALSSPSCLKKCYSLHVLLTVFFFLSFQSCPYCISVIPCQINTGHNPTLSQLNDFLRDCSPNGDKYSCQILLLLATRFLKAGIQSSQKTRFLATRRRKSGITSALIEIQSSHYAHFKANKMPFPVTYYTDIFSTVMF
jgi:hypothetical protein